MKILHVGNHTIPCVGGIENVIWGVAKAQARAGNEVHILVFDTDTTGKEKLAAEERREGVHIHRIPQLRVVSFYRIPFSSRLLGLAKGMDIIHVHGFGAWVDVLLVLKPLYTAKLVVNTHGGFFHTPHFAAIKRAYLGWLRLGGRGIDYLICDSPNDFERFSFAGKKATLIPNGVEVESLLDIPLSKKKMNHAIFVGRLSQNKRVDRLLEVWANVARKDKKAHLHIVGEDWENLLVSLQQKVNDLRLEKNVTFHGKISDAALRKLYATCGICVSASQYEGFGVSIIEGMAAGCIPALNDVPSFRAFVGEKNARGVITTFAQPEEAAKTLIQLSRTPLAKKKKWQAACKKYAETFSWSSITKEYAKIYAQT